MTKGVGLPMWWGITYLRVGSNPAVNLPITLELKTRSSCSGCRMYCNQIPLKAPRFSVRRIFR